MANYTDYNLSDKKDVKNLEAGRRMRGSILVTIDAKGHRTVHFRLYGTDKEAQAAELLHRVPVHTTAHGCLYRLSSCWKAVFRFPHGQMTAGDMGDLLSDEADTMSDYVIDHATI